MSSITEVQGIVLARLITEHPNLLEEVDQMVASLPERDRSDFYQRIVSKPSNGKLTIDENVIVDKNSLPILSANEILTTKWPEPLWAVPGLLPVGLTILAGAPKIGKSWISLQIAKAISLGGEFLGEMVNKGPVLIFALEDTPQRLQNRMNAMGWPSNLEVDFLTIPRTGEQSWNMLNGGGEKLARLMKQKGYRLVVIDTLSRAIPGDQQDVQAMTRALTPLQEMALQVNCALMINDHHRKAGAANSDAIADILGSTAKGAMADTVWSLYRERGKNGAKLTVTGRDVEEQTLQLEFNSTSCLWSSHGNTTTLNITERRQEILDALTKLGRVQIMDLCDYLNQDKGNLHPRLQDLVNAGLVKREKISNNVYYELAN